eukprot:Phypoly_transcript_21223.p1 GENE.Phypoly_transcript_21223~~Phypoly_transcript_21223.p1  ORF type:complete len:121 (+),score=7.55 Phypoly_transcript_21223:73-435(+)
MVHPYPEMYSVSELILPPVLKHRPRSNVACKSNSFHTETPKLMQKAPRVSMATPHCSPNQTLRLGLGFEHVMLGPEKQQVCLSWPKPGEILVDPKHIHQYTHNTTSDATTNLHLYTHYSQ